MTCPTTGACLTCRMAGLATCPFKQTCGPNLPLCFGELPKVTVKHRVWPEQGSVDRSGKT